MALIAEIDETASRTVALLADRVAGSQGALVDLVIVLWPARPMLHTLMPTSEEIAIHARRFAALLDQLELHIPRVRQGDGDVRVVVAPAGVGKAGHRQAIGIEPGSDAADLHPMAHRGFDIAHNNA